MNAWTYAWIVGAGALITDYYLRQWRRSAAIRVLADRAGFKYLRDTLPRSINLTGTPFHRLTSTRNVFDGDCQGIRVVAFDCQVGTGKGKWRTTVITAHTGENVFPGVAFNPDLAINHSVG